MRSFKRLRRERGFYKTDPRMKNIEVPKQTKEVTAASPTRR